MTTIGWLLFSASMLIFAYKGYRALAARADRERAALYAQGGEVVPRGKGNVVPFASMLHIDHHGAPRRDGCPGCASADEQDSAEAYDDLPEQGDDTLAMLHGMSEEDWREHLRLSDAIDRAQDALNAHVAHVEAKSIETTWADLHDLPVSEWPGGAS